jgi:hypothetical protein
VSAPGDYDNEEIGGMIGRGNRSTRRKPAPVPLCPPQTPHAARTRTRAAAVGSQRLTAELQHGLRVEIIAEYKIRYMTMDSGSCVQCCVSSMGKGEKEVTYGCKFGSCIVCIQFCNRNDAVFTSRQFLVLDVHEVVYL